MKNSETLLTHDEIMFGLSKCFRELIKTSVTHRSMPIIINRGKAVAGIVTAAHKEEIMHVKRQRVFREIKVVEKQLKSRRKK